MLVAVGAVRKVLGTKLAVERTYSVVHIHMVVILPFSDKPFLANVADQWLFTVSSVMDLDVIADLALFDLLATVITDHKGMVGFAVRLERVLALVDGPAFSALVNLIGVAFSFVKPVPPLFHLLSALFTGDQLVAVLACHVTLMDKLFVLFQVVHALKHFATLATHKSFVTAMRNLVFSQFCVGAEDFVTLITGLSFHVHNGDMVFHALL